MFSLHHAARRGDVYQLIRLTREGRYPERDYEGNTPLHEAAFTDQAEAARFLCYDDYALIHARNDLGRTPLHVAARYGSTEVIRILDRAGANPNLRDNNGETALHLAARKGHIRALSLLVYTTDTEYLNIEGETALHLAISINRLPAVAALVNGGASYRTRSRAGESALDFAARIGASKEIVDFLLFKGARAHDRTVCGYSPYMVARLYGHETLLDSLDDEYALRLKHISLLNSLTGSWPLPDGGSLLCEWALPYELLKECASLHLSPFIQRAFASATITRTPETLLPILQEGKELVLMMGFSGSHIFPIVVLRNLLLMIDRAFDAKIHAYQIDPSAWTLGLLQQLTDQKDAAFFYEHLPAMCSLSGRINDISALFEPIKIKKQKASNSCVGVTAKMAIVLSFAATVYQEKETLTPEDCRYISLTSKLARLALRGEAEKALTACAAKRGISLAPILPTILPLAVKRTIKTAIISLQLT